MPLVNGVGKPCAGEPHARIDGRELETERCTGHGRGEEQPRRETAGRPRLHDLPPIHATAPAPDPPVAGGVQVSGDTPMAGGWPGEAQDPGRRDVFSRMSTTEVLRCLILSPTPPSFRSARRPCCSCRGCWPPNDAVAGLAHAGARWAAIGRRSWCCAGFSMAPGWPSRPPTTGSPRSTAYRYLHEGIAALARSEEHTSE